MMIAQHVCNKQERNSSWLTLRATSRRCSRSTELVILLEWEDVGQAREFAQSADLRQAMQRAGVADQPDVYFLEEVERPSV
jgi:hypothetical protein